jgi:hypothetical protein
MKLILLNSCKVTSKQTHEVASRLFEFRVGILVVYWDMGAICGEVEKCASR